MSAVTCSQCGSILTDSGNEANRQPCPTCGSTSRTFHVHIEEKVGFFGSLGLKQKRKGKKKPIFEEISGTTIRELDGTLVKKVRVIDREKNTYLERICDKKTGEVIHECMETLSDHKGHGSDKKKVE